MPWIWQKKQTNIDIENQYKYRETIYSLVIKGEGKERATKPEEEKNPNDKFSIKRLTQDNNKRIDLNLNNNITEEEKWNILK